MDEDDSDKDVLVIDTSASPISFGFDSDNDKLYFLVGNEDLETYNLYRMNVP